MSTDRIYKEFETGDGRKVLLRPLCWDDLDACLEFAKGLALEYAEDVHHGTMMARAPNRADEAEWLGDTLVSIEKGNTVSVAAEVEGALAGNSEVVRSSHPDLVTHGQLGIAVSKRYRGLGIGSAMLATLLDQCRLSLFKTVQLAALGSNERAISLYERVGFRKVGVVPRKIRRRGVAIDEMIMSIEL